MKRRFENNILWLQSTCRLHSTACCQPPHTASQLELASFFLVLHDTTNTGRTGVFEGLAMTTGCYQEHSKCGRQAGSGAATCRAAVSHAARWAGHRCSNWLLLLLRGKL
jgi:hypothetical protein